MEATPNAAAVTPQGVRDGDPAALRALVARRGPAVVAFCSEILGPVEAPRAAAEALARFRAAVHAADDPTTLNPDALLLGAARHACAALVPLSPPGGRLRRRDAQQCGHVPALLAGRAGGALGPADQERLDRHLKKCDRCRELSDAFLRAERAYAEAPDEPLPPRTTALLVAALTASAPVAGEEPPPVAESPPAPALGSPAVAESPPAPVEEPQATPEEPPAPPPAEERPATPEEPPAPPPVEEPPPAPADEPPAPAEEPPGPVEAPRAATDEPAPLPEPVAATAEPPPTEPLTVEEIGVADVDAPVVDHPGDADLGETAEFDNLPEVASEHHGPLGGRLLGGGRERRGGISRGARIGVPVVVVAGGIVAALAIAGVFGGDDPSPSKPQTVAPPVSTPSSTR